MIDVHLCANINDYKTKQMCWIYDLNYRPSLSCVTQRRIIERFRAILPVDEKLDALILKLQNYVANPPSEDDMAQFC
jgi:hypothetical protein